MGQYGTAGPSVSGSPVSLSALNAEEIRLTEAREGRAPWKKWDLMRYRKTDTMQLR